MQIQIVSYEPRMTEAGVPDSYFSHGTTKYPFVVTFLLNGMQYQGEAAVISTPPWWEINATYDAEIIPNEKSAGGNRLSITRPQQQHTGGSSFRGNTAQNQTQQPIFGQPQPTGQPAQAPGRAPIQPAPQDDPFKRDLRGALIVSQSSMKIATEYITHLSKEERDLLAEKLGTENDLIVAYGNKIAREVYELAEGLLQKKPF